MKRSSKRPGYLAGYQALVSRATRAELGDFGKASGADKWYWGAMRQVADALRRNDLTAAITVAVTIGDGPTGPGLGITGNSVSGVLNNAVLLNTFKARVNAGSATDWWGGAVFDAAAKQNANNLVDAIAAKAAAEKAAADKALADKAAADKAEADRAAAQQQRAAAAQQQQAAAAQQQAAPAPAQQASVPVTVPATDGPTAAQKEEFTALTQDNTQAESIITAPAAMAPPSAYTGGGSTPTAAPPTGPAAPTDQQKLKELAEEYKSQKTSGPIAVRTVASPTRAAEPEPEQSIPDLLDWLKNNLFGSSGGGLGSWSDNRLIKYGIPGVALVGLAYILLKNRKRWL